MGIGVVLNWYLKRKERRISRKLHEYSDACIKYACALESFKLLEVDIHKPSVYFRKGLIPYIFDEENNVNLKTLGVFIYISVMYINLKRGSYSGTVKKEEKFPFLESKDPVNIYIEGETKKVLLYGIHRNGDTQLQPFFDKDE